MLILTVQQHSHQKRYYLGSDYRGVYLTPREVDVLKASLFCNTYKEIANHLGLSVRTIEAYFKPIKIKLSCDHKKQVVQVIVGMNFIDQIKDIESNLYHYELIQ